MTTLSTKLPKWWSFRNEGATPLLVAMATTTIALSRNEGASTRANEEVSETPWPTSSHPHRRASTLASGASIRRQKQTQENRCWGCAGGTAPPGPIATTTWSTIPSAKSNPTRIHRRALCCDDRTFSAEENHISNNHRFGQTQRQRHFHPRVFDSLLYSTNIYTALGSTIHYQNNHHNYAAPWHSLYSLADIVIPPFCSVTISLKFC